MKGDSQTDTQKQRDTEREEQQQTNKKESQLSKGVRDRQTAHEASRPVVRVSSVRRSPSQLKEPHRIHKANEAPRGLECRSILA